MYNSTISTAIVLVNYPPRQTSI